MAGRSVNSFGSANKDWSPGPPSTRYNVSGKSREYYTFENAPGIGAYATGGTIVDGGDGYIYHVFLANGTFTVNRPSAAIDSVEYLIVAGGGGHLSATPLGGGGGGGGFIFGNINVTNTPGSYPITIGSGGPNGPSPTPAGRNGSPSTAFGLTAAGGGGGATPGPPTIIATGANGGSGGGGAPAPVAPGGTGNTPSLIPRQGYPGGSAPPLNYGGGGGGAGGPGSNGASGVGGDGGPGRVDERFPSTIIKKAIPAALLPSWEPLVGPGGYAAGGKGSTAAGLRTTPANSGYGGNFTNSSGGSGIVCIRYKKTSPYTRATGGVVEPSTDPNHPGVWRHIFTSPGTFTVTDPSLTFIDYLAVGGGGGGGGAQGGGGGGGGFVSSIETSTSTPTTIPEAYSWAPGVSVRVGEKYPVASASYPITIGTGGSGGVGIGSAGTNGTNTTIGAPGQTQIISYGGGGGGSGPSSPPYFGPGRPGGSGGGGSVGAFPVVTTNAGLASPSPFIQGNPGYSSPGTQSGGGGGGAGTANPGAFVGNNGGNGWYSVISPPSYGTPGPIAGYRYFSGGGGGGLVPAGIGGVGGGGNGGTFPTPTTGITGTTNTGGGGGGGGPSSAGSTGGTGGPGIVIIQYPE